MNKPEMAVGRICRNGKWVDVPVPLKIADLVNALNRAYCEVASVTDDTITLKDGRALHVEFADRLKDGGSA
jgi:hypothetical protein